MHIYIYIYICYTQCIYIYICISRQLRPVSPPESPPKFGPAPGQAHAVEGGKTSQRAWEPPELSPWKISAGWGKY